MNEETWYVLWCLVGIPVLPWLCLLHPFSSTAKKTSWSANLLLVCKQLTSGPRYLAPRWSAPSSRALPLPRPASGAADRPAPPTSKFRQWRVFLVLNIVVVNVCIASQRLCHVREGRKLWGERRFRQGKGGARIPNFMYIHALSDPLVICHGSSQVFTARRWKARAGDPSTLVWHQFDFLFETFASLDPHSPGVVILPSDNHPTSRGSSGRIQHMKSREILDRHDTWRSPNSSIARSE